jgi:hypothetical protein
MKTTGKRSREIVLVACSLLGGQRGHEADPRQREPEEPCQHEDEQEAWAVPAPPLCLVLRGTYSTPLARPSPTAMSITPTMRRTEARVTLGMSRAPTKEPAKAASVAATTSPAMSATSPKDTL